jgi:hypothetical protein
MHYLMYCHSAIHICLAHMTLLAIGVSLKIITILIHLYTQLSKHLRRYYWILFAFVTFGSSIITP